MIILSEVRAMFGRLKKLDKVTAYYDGIIKSRDLSDKQRAIIDEIYQRRVLELAFKLPKRDKR